MAKFEIWYMKPEWFGEGILGGLPDKSDLAKTHVHLTDIELVRHSSELEEIWRMMQAEMWSPNGEARQLIEEKGLAHTSMSVGDAIKLGDEVWVAAGVGFNTL